VIELLGFAAGALTAFAFLPQVVKTWRTRSSGDLSLAMLGAQSAGVSLWASASRTSLPGSVLKRLRLSRTRAFMISPSSLVL